ncbi:unnamed protein product, partial [Ectocarpus sp. 12 AP-2014]
MSVVDRGYQLFGTPAQAKQRQQTVKRRLVVHETLPRGLRDGKRDVCACCCPISFSPVNRFYSQICVEVDVHSTPRESCHRPADILRACSLLLFGQSNKYSCRGDTCFFCFCCCSFVVYHYVRGKRPPLLRGTR